MIKTFQYKTVAKPKNYVSEPCAVVTVSVRSVGGTCTESRKFPARLDTGSDITIVPGYILEDVSLLQGGKYGWTDIGGTIRHNYQAYQCDLMIFDEDCGPSIWTICPPRGVLVAPKQEYALLGMDVLEHFKLVLDASSQSFTMEFVYK